MKRLKIFGIIAIAVIGAYFIYIHFDKVNKKDEVYNKFSTEYTLVDTNNKFKYSTIDEIIDILSNKTGIVFFCTPDSEWCQHYALYLDKATKDENVIISYLDIKDYREVNTIKYQKILELLDSYIYKDDSNNKKIFMPDLTFVNNGKIVAHNNDTSLVSSEITPQEYWTNERILSFKNEITNDIIKMNEEIVEEEPTVEEN